MGRSGDYGRPQDYQRQAGDGRRRGPAAVPPQFSSDAPARMDGTRPVQEPRYRQPLQSAFTPGYQAQPQPRYSQPQQPASIPGYQAQPPQGYYPPPQAARQPQYAPGPAPQKKRRVFLWVFLGIQALFIVWIIAGLASHPAGPTAAQQAAQQCANGGWKILFKSQADCQTHYAHALNEAGNVGKGIGVAFIVIVWMVVDFFMGLGYGIYRLASRH